MSAPAEYQRLHLAGLLLLAATAANWLLNRAFDTYAWALVLLVAALKCRIVMREFMGMKEAPRAWRVAFDLWLLALTLVVAAAKWRVAAA